MKTLDHLAYNSLPGKSPTVVFLSGFKSDMEGTKALFLETICRGTGHAFIRFDYSGHGKSGGKFEDGTIGLWKADALKIIDELTTGPLILIGSSMGGWIMLLAALARPERIKALIGIAAAPDFTEELIWQKFTPAQKDQLTKTGRVQIENCYDGQEPYPITKNLIEEGRNHLLLNHTAGPELVSGSLEEIPKQVWDLLPSITCPIHLIHGTADEDVPYQTSTRIAGKVSSQDLQTHFIENGTHRLSEPDNLNLLKNTLLAMLAKC